MWSSKVTNYTKEFPDTGKTLNRSPTKRETDFDLKKKEKNKQKWKRRKRSQRDTFLEKIKRDQLIALGRKWVGFSSLLLHVATVGIRLSKNYPELNLVSRRLHESKKEKRRQTIALKCLILSFIVGCGSLKKTPWRLCPPHQDLAWFVEDEPCTQTDALWEAMGSVLGEPHNPFVGVWGTVDHLSPGRSTVPLFSSSSLIHWLGMDWWGCTFSSSLWTCTQVARMLVSSESLLETWH